MEKDIEWETSALAISVPQGTEGKEGVSVSVPKSKRKEGTLALQREANTFCVFIDSLTANEKAVPKRKRWQTAVPLCEEAHSLCRLIAKANRTKLGNPKRDRYAEEAWDTLTDIRTDMDILIRENFESHGYIDTRRADLYNEKLDTIEKLFRSWWESDMTWKTDKKEKCRYYGKANHETDERTCSGA